MGLLVASSAPAQAQFISGPAPLPAPVRLTVTAEDLVHLRANGLGDDVLLALIDSHKAVFQLTAADVLALRQRGLSDRVLTAMLRSGRPAPLASESVTPRATAPMPIDAVEFEPAGAEPVWREAQDDRDRADRGGTVVNVSQTVNTSVEQPRRYYEQVAVPVAVPVYVDRPDRVDRPRSGGSTTEYWGYGGERRPDSWAPSSGSRPSPRPEPKPEVKPESKPAARDAEGKDAKVPTRSGRGGASE